MASENLTERQPDQTLGQLAYDSIRSDILKGHFAPGSPLRLQALKERYGFSFSPLREALNRLQSEQLVVSYAARGFRVTEISLEEMWDAIDTRILIDCEAFRRSIRRGDDDWEGRVMGAFHALSRAFERNLELGAEVTEDQVHQLEDRHRAFHHALVSESGSNWMKVFSTQLYNQTQRYRWPYFSTRGGNVFLKKSYLAEHREIAERAVARDEEAAVALMAKGFRRTGEIIESLLKGEDETDRGT
ncbi:GntR family transcriptional regulator [Pseudooceanicola marinus]|uniref:GntR family transcriptional regulator n=1 Tax=Pseudooceanicola marinus TaxID=396013 RepID=UPI001C97B0EB|nr:GntR family transcriptional regulator [Pseudooceanicola marinus]MBY5973399.1 FCD domain-containing protein [Ferrimonas balearica]MCA1336356.1 FCD domain-containing protein [Pseudooceanicola marinus]